MILFIVLVVATVTAGFSRIGRKLGEGLPLAALIAFQGFRLPLELVMHRAATEGSMPDQMTFTGLNFDIASGITAIVAAFLVARGIAPRVVVEAVRVSRTLEFATQRRASGRGISRGSRHAFSVESGGACRGGRSPRSPRAQADAPSPS